MLASDNRKRVYPYEGDHSVWVDIKALNWHQKEKAKRSRTNAQIKDFAELGEALQSLTHLSDGRETTAASTDPVDHFDMGLVLHGGIIGWTLGDPVDHNQIDDLDASVATDLAREILYLSGERVVSPLVSPLTLIADSTGAATYQRSG